MKIFIARAI